MSLEQLKTRITWNLNDYCESECSYCPVHLRGGSEPPETKDYLRIANLLIDTYRNQNRTIDWIFNGGEPLDMKDIVTLLKLCRQNGNSMTLHTNGGKLWMDWWAIEPYVDNLHLTFHYWQNPSLISYIIDTFTAKSKSFKVYAPIRPEYFDEDIERTLKIEQVHNIVVGKSVLYHHASRDGGMFNYTKEQLAIMSGVKIVKKETIQTASLVVEKQKHETVPFVQRLKETISTNPSYTGKLCNVGIEFLNISHTGWATGSDCNNQPLGNIWHDGWKPPMQPQICTMQACMSPSDRSITKFDIT
jgi:organic radical activating enzyme